RSGAKRCASKYVSSAEMTTSVSASSAQASKAASVKYSSSRPARQRYWLGIGAPERLPVPAQGMRAKKREVTKSESGRAGRQSKMDDGFYNRRFAPGAAFVFDVTPDARKRVVPL